MKRSLFSLLLCLTANFTFAGNYPSENTNPSVESNLRSNSAIDIYDTVVFDISQSVLAGNQVSFPVYFISDDTINALDFSLQFDETNFSLDTIANLTTYLLPVYNFTLGTLYFTSYSLQEIENSTSLVSIRFNMLGHYLCSNDLYSILAYLNGDPCSVKVIECLSDKITEAGIRNLQPAVFPNPSTGILNIEAKEDGFFQLLDINGSSVIYQSAISSVQPHQINVSGYAPGIYLLKLMGTNSVHISKVIIN